MTNATITARNATEGDHRLLDELADEYATGRMLQVRGREKAHNALLRMRELGFSYRMIAVAIGAEYTTVRSNLAVAMQWRKRHLQD